MENEKLFIVKILLLAILRLNTYGARHSMGQVQVKAGKTQNRFTRQVEISPFSPQFFWLVHLE
jgi:hypothetical protein